MANHTLYTTPVFNENLRKYETEDEVHADVFNAVDERLINNDYFLKKNLDDVTKNSKEHRENNEIHVTKKQKEEWSAKAENTEVTKEKKGLMSVADKTKLDGIVANAEVNQNAFSNVKVGGTTVAAHTKTTTVELAAGTNIQLAADNATKKIIINGPSNVTTAANGLMTKEDKTKLDGIAEKANNYSHPNTHPATIITQDGTHRFVTDNEKNTWSGKANTTPVTPTANGLMTKEDKVKLNGIAENANNYIHPNTHPASMITGLPTSLPANGGNASTVNNHKVNKDVPANAAFTDTTYPYYNKAIDKDFATKFRTQTKGNTVEGNYISNVRAEASNVHFLPQYGSGLAWGSMDTHGYLNVSYSGADVYIGGGNADKLNWVKRILLEGDALPVSGGTLQGALKILDSHPLDTRHVDGLLDGFDGALHLNYNRNAPIYLGNGGGATISADGRAYSGNSATASALKSTDNRSVATNPEDYIAEFKNVGIKVASVVGLPGNYCSIIGYRGYHNSSDGVAATEWAFSDNGNIYRRRGFNNAAGWGAWANIKDVDTAHMLRALTTDGNLYNPDSYNIRAQFSGGRNFKIKVFNGNQDVSNDYDIITTYSLNAGMLENKHATDIVRMGGKHLAGQGAGGGYSFLGDGTEDTGMFSDSDGDLYFMQNGVRWTPIVSQNGSIAVGSSAVAQGISSSAFGQEVKAIGNYSHAEGFLTEAKGSYSHTEGLSNKASGEGAHVGGVNSTASGSYSFTHGDKLHNNSNYCTVIGISNNYLNYTSDNGEGNDATLFAIGGGIIRGGNGSTLTNVLRVNRTGGLFINKPINTSGADLAELYQWEDDNKNNEDRRGLFVTTVGRKIKIAKKGDYILGAISSVPSVIGNSPEEWDKRYIRDVFGNILYETKEVFKTKMEEVPSGEFKEELVEKEIVNENNEKEIITETKKIEVMTMKEIETDEKITITVPKENPDYRKDEPYIDRMKRKEWAPVGIHGQLIIVDDGTSEVDGFCKPTDGGIATKANTNKGYRVLERLDDTHIRIVMETIREFD